MYGYVFGKRSVSENLFSRKLIYEVLYTTEVLNLQNVDVLC